MKPELREALARGELAGRRCRLVLPRDAAAGYAGFHAGRQAGSSLDFKDYRDYHPGDDLRHIDWHVYARTDRLTLKLFREEVRPHVDIVVDGSRSMALAPGVKAEATLGLAAFLAAAAANARCTHCAWLAGRGLERVANGAESPSRWDRLELDYPGSPADALGAGAAWRRGGIRILISDLLWLGEPLSVLRRFGQGAAAVAVLQVLAPGDADPPAPGHVRLEDVETGETLDLFVDVAGRARYARALEQHRQNWERACQQAHACLATVPAEPVTAQWRPKALEEQRIVEAD